MRSFYSCTVSICGFGKYNKSEIGCTSDIEYGDIDKQVSLINKEFKDREFKDLRNNISNEDTFENTLVWMNFDSFDEFWDFFECHSSSKYFNNFRFSFIEKKNNKILEIYDDIYCNKVKFKNNKKFYKLRIHFCFSKIDDKLTFKEIMDKLDYKQFIDFLNDNNIVKKSIEIL